MRTSPNSIPALTDCANSTSLEANSSQELEKASEWPSAQLSTSSAAAAPSRYNDISVTAFDTQQSQFVHHYFLFKVGVLILGWLHLIFGLFFGLIFTVAAVALKPEHLVDTESLVKISDDKVYTHIYVFYECCLCETLTVSTLQLPRQHGRRLPVDQDRLCCHCCSLLPPCRLG